MKVLELIDRLEKKIDLVVNILLSAELEGFSLECAREVLPVWDKKRRIIFEEIKVCLERKTFRGEDHIEDVLKAYMELLELEADEFLEKKDLETYEVLYYTVIQYPEKIKYFIERESN